MTQTPAQSTIEFRQWAESLLAEQPNAGKSVDSDREDGSTLTTRWPVADDLFLEITVRPLIPQVRIGIVTDDRWKSEEIEQAIQDSGDNMSEYLELAFSEAGLDWEEPPVEHYRHEGKWFSFITPLEIGSLGALDDDAMRDKVARMVRGYLASYGKL